MFLAVKENSDRFWIEDSGDLVAQDLAAGSTNKYWLISKNEQSGIVTLKPVIATVAEMISVKRIKITAGGIVVGSADSN